jgi:hypothetical protein
VMLTKEGRKEAGQQGRKETLWIAEVDHFVEKFVDQDEVFPNRILRQNAAIVLKRRKEGRNGRHERGTGRKSRKGGGGGG